MFCPHCGNNVPEGSAFCPSCGCNIAQRAKTPKPSQASSSASAGKQRPFGRVPTVVEGMRPTQRKLVIGAVAIIAVLVIANVIRSIAFPASADVNQSPITASDGGGSSELDKDKYGIVKASNASLEDYDANAVPADMRLGNFDTFGNTEYTTYILTVDLENSSDHSVRADILLEGTLNWTDGYGDTQSVSVAYPITNRPPQCLAPGEKRTAKVPVYVATEEKPIPNWNREYGMSGMSDRELVDGIIDGESGYNDEVWDKLPDDSATNIYLSDLTCTRTRAYVLDDTDEDKIYLPINKEVIKMAGKNDSGITVLGVNEEKGRHFGDLTIVTDCMVTNTSSYNLSSLKVAGYVLYDGVMTAQFLTVYTGARAEYVKAGETAEVKYSEYTTLYVPADVDTSKLSFYPTAIVGTIDRD